MYKYFSEKDFTRCSPPCSMQDMSESFLKKLDKARLKAGIPFVLTSAYRTYGHEISKGRDGSSSHTKGLAVDIRAISSTERFKIVIALNEAGLNRIGIGRTFIHVDGDTDKPKNVMFHYYKKNNVKR